MSTIRILPTSSEISVFFNFSRKLPLERIETPLLCRKNGYYSLVLKIHYACVSK